MKNQKQKLRVASAIIAFLLALSIQSCTKEELLQPANNIGSQARVNKGASGLIEWQGETPDACKQVCLVAGQNNYVGSVDAVIVEGDLYITYSVTVPNVYLKEVHLDVFNSLDQLKESRKLSKAGAIPGKFAYQNGWESSKMINSHTVKVPQSYLEGLGTDCFYIATHAALSNGESAWGGLCDETENGVSLDNAKQFPGKNWSVYFEFCQEECAESIDFTYAWEDLLDNRNDSDYNDLVVQSDIIRSSSELKITFLATARGAKYDHKFNVKIPKQGITSIFGESSFTEDENFYYITVFESTRAILPGYANTQPSKGCTPFAYKEIVLTTDGSFSYNSNQPYEPFISVYPSGNVNTGDYYDLYIYEVSGTGTWIDRRGKKYPNGIIIPEDWKWLIEVKSIRWAYPDFTSLSDGWNPKWAENLADPSYTFDTGICE